MERLSGGLMKGGKGLSRGGAAATADKASAKGKFKLLTSKDPLPLLAKKQLSRQTKPKAEFLASARAIETQNIMKSSIFAANSFMRPLATDGPVKKSAGFSLMKFQPKYGELGQSISGTSTKAAPSAFTDAHPSLGKFAVNSLTKKKNSSTSGAGPRLDKVSLFKLHSKGTLPFAFRAETKSSAAKKRKAAESFTEDKKNSFPSKTRRVAPSFTLITPTGGKEKDSKKLSAACGKSTEPLGSSVPFATKMGGVKIKPNDAAVLKKRSTLATSTVAAPAWKKSKTQLVPELGDPSRAANGVTKSGSSGSALHGEDDSDSPSALVPVVVKSSQTSPDFVAEKAQSRIVPPSPDCTDDCLSGIEEELAMKLLCTVDDDQEDEFLARAAAIQEFTDRVGLEQKQLRKRLLDAHADVSESLLDALTDLVAEEGGIGIDKLDFDMNIDVNVVDPFLQDDEIQVIQ